MKNSNNTRRVVWMPTTNPSIARISALPATSISHEAARRPVVAPTLAAKPDHGESEPGVRERECADAHE